MSRRRLLLGQVRVGAAAHVDLEGAGLAAFRPLDPVVVAAVGLADVAAWRRRVPRPGPW